MANKSIKSNDTVTDPNVKPVNKSTEHTGSFYLIFIPDENTVKNAPNQMIVPNEVKVFLETMCRSEIDSSLRRVYSFNSLRFFMVSKDEVSQNKE